MIYFSSLHRDGQPLGHRLMLHWACTAKGAHKCHSEKCHLPFWQCHQFNVSWSPSNTKFDKFVFILLHMDHIMTPSQLAKHGKQKKRGPSFAVAAGESAAAGDPTVTPVAICADGEVT